MYVRVFQSAQDFIRIRERTQFCQAPISVDIKGYLKDQKKSATSQQTRAQPRKQIGKRLFEKKKWWGT